MYNQKIYESIKRYREKMKDTPEWREKRRNYSKEFYDKNKLEQNETYERVKMRNRINYYKKMKLNDKEKFLNKLNNIKDKDEFLYKNLLEII